MQPKLTDVVCSTTPARYDNQMHDFDVWTEITRCVEGTIKREIQE